ncbi:hypothetical protein PPYR_11206 [Photinus pyralis]|uniref:Tetraspanin n=1 Tax=Photinus pyralis TaxID=7054 RepID=A0A5N4AAM3_PHOPY|nr:hypothetical protein PPYR_11206 [Photinus pyralis]
MGCATSIVKYLVFLFNFIFVLAGIAFIVIGVLIKLDVSEFKQVLDKIDLPFSVAPILMIVVGVVVFVIAFFGCCGAIKESTCLLTTYAVILLVILIAQIAVGIYAFIQTKETSFKESDVQSGFAKLISDYGIKTTKEAVDFVQEELKCCGAKDKNDWHSQIPASCCKGVQDPNYCPADKAYSSGCGEELYNFLIKSFNIIGIVIIVIAAVELFGAVFALCLSSSIKNNERRGHYA